MRFPTLHKQWRNPDPGGWLAEKTAHTQRTHSFESSSPGRCYTPGGHQAKRSWLLRWEYRTFAPCSEIHRAWRATVPSCLPALSAPTPCSPQWSAEYPLVRDGFAVFLVI